MEENLAHARALHGRALRWSSGAIAFVLLGIGAMRVRPFARRQWLGAVSIGLWAAMMPAARPRSASVPRERSMP